MRALGNFFNLVREMTDDIHHWYHDGELAVPEIGAMLGGIHVHDSLVVLEKARPFAPVHSNVGS